MEMINCKLPDVYSKLESYGVNYQYGLHTSYMLAEFKETPYYGHCFRSTIQKCKAYVLLQQLNKKDNSVEMFA